MSISGKPLITVVKDNITYMDTRFVGVSVTE